MEQAIKPPLKRVEWVAFVCFLLFLGCQEPQLKYLEKVPKVYDFEYLEPNDWKHVYIDTAVVQTWYSSSDSSKFFIAHPSNMVEVGEQEFWVSDYVQGEVLKLDMNGSVIEKVLSSGRGPSEIIRPYAMNVLFTINDTTIYILDGESKSILGVDKSGVVKKRVYSRSIENRLMESDFKAVQKNSLLYPNYSEEHYALSEYDSLGNFKKGLVERIIPIGKQPITYNDVVFDLRPKENLFAYAYQGLPLVFVENPGLGFLLNLQPGKEISKINTPLEIKNEEAALSVKKLIRAVSIEQNQLMVGYQSELVIVPFDRTQPIHWYDLIDENGEPVAFHFMEITQNHLFLINGYRGIIYSLNKQTFIDQTVR